MLPSSSVLYHHYISWFFFLLCTNFFSIIQFLDICLHTQNSEGWADQTEPPNSLWGLLPTLHIFVWQTAIGRYPEIQTPKANHIWVIIDAEKKSGWESLLSIFKICTSGHVYTTCVQMSTEVKRGHGWLGAVVVEAAHHLICWEPIYSSAKAASTLNLWNIPLTP